MKNPVRLLALVFMGSGPIACSAPNDGEPTVTIIREAITLITTESEMIAAPGDMAVAADGDVFILDAQLARVLVVAPNGTVRRTIAREGSGPGELQRPAALALDRDTLRVVDAGNGRMQLFSLGGEYLRTGPVPAASGGPLSLRSDGWLVAGTRGRDSTLAKYFDEHAVHKGSFGDPIVPAAMLDFVAIKNEIASGEIPSALRNVGRPFFANDGGFWMMFLADPLIHRYTARDSLAWALTLDVVEVDTILEYFFERNRQIGNANAFYPLSYFTDAVVVDDRFWVLLNVPDEIPSSVLVVSSEGLVEHRIVFENVRGANVLAVDPVRRRIYLTVRSAATLMVAPFPDGI